MHGARGPHLGGLCDRLGQRRFLFDIDGTHKAYRQRAIAEGKDRPGARRRAAALAAPGYAGRKRGEVVRGRMTVQQAHTSEWLGSYGEAGNGERWPRLEKIADRVVQYMRAHVLDPSLALLRFDGEFGWAHTVLLLAARGLGYLMRCVDYRLLDLPQVQQALLQPPQRFEQVDTGTVREVFEVGWVPWTSKVDQGATVTTRLVVTRTRTPDATAARVGKRRGEWVYEMFVASCGPEALIANDVLSLYFGRGGFEQTLSQEDEELELDRWVSGNPHGQEMWQILGQWVWNKRLQLGLAAASCEPRRTLWSEAIAAGDVAPESASSPTPADAPAPSAERVEPVSPTSPAAPMPAASDALMPAASAVTADEPEPMSSADRPAAGGPPASPASTADTASSTPPTNNADVSAPTNAVTPANVPERAGFVLQPDGTLLCPAHKVLRQVEVRGNRIRFMARAPDCRACPQAAQCMRRGAAGKNGRRVDWPAAVPASTHAPPDLPPAAPPQPPPPRFTPPSRPGPHPLYWDDLPATQLRRRLPAALWQQRIDGLPPPLTAPPAPRVLTRDQRAHRRLNWNARLVRNARPPSASPISLRLHGVPTTLAAYLGLQRDG